MTQPSSPSPTATYRLQLQPDFPFAAAERAVPHLAALGVSHLHLSPVLEAVPGSAHGYDVVDHAVVRAELGGEEGLRALAATARSHGLGLIVDIVPNHMAVPTPASLNGPLWEVLRDGPQSPYARWFDIDWDGGHGGRLLLPVLGGRIGEEARHLRVEGRCAALSRARVSAAARDRGAAARPSPGRPVVPAGLVAAGPQRAELPPLLHHFGADRRARRGPGGLRGDARHGAAADARGRHRRAPRRPSGRAGGPGRLSGPAGRRDGRPVDGGGEDPDR